MLVFDFELFIGDLYNIRLKELKEERNLLCASVVS